MLTIIKDDPDTINRTNGDRTPNRCNAAPEVGIQAPVGADSVRARGRGRHGFAHRRTWSHLNRLTGVVTERSTSAMEVLPSGVVLRADDRHGEHVYVEFSVPKFMWGSNVVAAPVALAREALRRVHEEAAMLVDWEHDWCDLELRRVDLVRDVHGVQDIGGLLDRLAVVPQARGRHRRRYTDPHLGQAESLTVGVPGRWQATLYDKRAEQLHLARRSRDPEQREFLTRQAERAAGQVRLEIGVRARPLRERLQHSRVAQLLREDLMAATAAHYFDLARLGTPVGGEAKVRTALRLMEENAKDNKMSDRMLGMLVREALGVGQAASVNTVQEHMAAARRYGLTAADMVLDARPTLRLDWETATVVEVAS